MRDRRAGVTIPEARKFSPWRMWTVLFAAFVLAALMLFGEQPVPSVNVGVGYSLGSQNPGIALAKPDVVTQAQVSKSYGKLPLSFIANTGQADTNVRFMVKGGRQTIFFTPEEVVFAASEKTEDEFTRSSVVSPGNEFLVGDTGNE